MVYKELTWDRRGELKEWPDPVALLDANVILGGQKGVRYTLDGYRNEKVARITPNEGAQRLAEALREGSLEGTIVVADVTLAEARIVADRFRVGNELGNWLKDVKTTYKSKGNRHYAFLATPYTQWPKFAGGVKPKDVRKEWWEATSSIPRDQICDKALLFTALDLSRLPKDIYVITEDRHDIWRAPVINACEKYNVKIRKSGQFLKEQASYKTQKNKPKETDEPKEPSSNAKQAKELKDKTLQQLLG